MKKLEIEANEARNDKDEQEIVYNILLRIQEKDHTMTLIDAAVEFCEYYDYDYDKFVKKCGSEVLERLREEALRERKIIGSRKLIKNYSVNDLFLTNS